MHMMVDMMSARHYACAENCKTLKTPSSFMRYQFSHHDIHTLRFLGEKLATLKLSNSQQLPFSLNGYEFGMYINYSEIKTKCVHKK